MIPPLCVDLSRCSRVQQLIILYLRNLRLNPFARKARTSFPDRKLKSLGIATALPRIWRLLVRTYIYVITSSVFYNPITNAARDGSGVPELFEEVGKLGLKHATGEQDHTRKDARRMLSRCCIM